jgi:hypothetical protein
MCTHVPSAFLHERWRANRRQDATEYSEVLNHKSMDLPYVSLMLFFRYGMEICHCGQGRFLRCMAFSS